MNAILTRIQKNYPVKARIHQYQLQVTGTFNVLLHINRTELNGAGILQQSRGIYTLYL
jgi:hypothetical protein